MGNLLIDQYTYLHFASGIIAYFWNISFKNWIMLHTIFEILENTNFGIKVINKFYYWSSFKKSYPDSLINILGDTLGASLGWLTAFYLDYLGHKYKWYDPHLIKN